MICGPNRYNGVLPHQLLRVNTKGAEKPRQFVGGVWTFLDRKVQFRHAYTNVAGQTGHLLRSTVRQFTTNANLLRDIA